MQGNFPETKYAFIPDVNIERQEIAQGHFPVNTEFVSNAYSEGRSTLSFAEAAYASWRYDSAVAAIANRLAKPNLYDENFVKSGGAQELERDMVATYGNHINERMLKEIRSVTSREDALHVKETIQNKLLTEQAWNDSFAGGMVGAVFAPENFLGGVVSTLTKSAIAVPKLATWLSKAIPKATEPLAYGGSMALAGGLQAVPGVLWNYDDPKAIPIAMAFGGALGVGMASHVDPNKFLDTLGSRPANKASLKTGDVMADRLASLMSLADELDNVMDGLGAALLGNPGKGIREDIDSAASRSASLVAQANENLYNLEQSFKELGLTNQTFIENVQQAVGMETTATKLDKKQVSLAMQRAAAYLGNTYNYNRTVQAREELTKTLIEKINDLESTLMYGEKTIAGELPELAKHYNELLKAKHIDTINTVGASGGVIPEPSKYVLPINVLVDVKAPDINSLTSLERGIVDAYHKSGIALKLGEIVNRQGNDMTKVASDSNYFHTRFDLNKIDDTANLAGTKLYQRDMKQYQATLDKIKAVENTIKLNEETAKKLVASNKAPRASKLIRKRQSKIDKNVAEVNRLKAVNTRLKAEVNKLNREAGAIKTRLNQEGINDYDVRGYLHMFKMIGTQMADAIAKSTGNADISAEQVGALLVSSMLPDVGHQGLRDALKYVEWKNTEKLAQILLEAGGDIHVNTALRDAMQADEFQGLNNMVKQATGLYEVSQPKLIGEASAFKSRFLWNYFQTDKELGLNLYTLLQDDFLNTATRNIQEECGRVALSNVKMMNPDGTEFFLNNPENIRRAQNLIRDYARNHGHGEETARDLATMTFDALLGRATGEKLSPAMQVGTQIAQMIQLKNSGLYNIVDTTYVAHTFGTAAMLRHFIPAIKMGLKTSTITKKDAQSLKDVVSRIYAMEARIRPDVTVISEDMTDAAKGKVARGIMNTAQYMRWINGQAQVSQWQANMCASLYEEAMHKAFRDNDWSMLERAGHTFNDEDIADIFAQYSQHGLDVKAWSDPILAEKVIRNCFDVTTNTALQVRRGDRPRFLNSAWGKVCFAYQSFVWASHNKLLRRYASDYGTLNACSLIIRQLPLSALMAISVQALNGKDPFEDQQALVNSIVNSTSALGLFGYAGSFMTAGIGGTSPVLGVANTYIGGVESLVTQGDPTGLLKNLPLLGGFIPYRIAIAAMSGALE